MTNMMAQVVYHMRRWSGWVLQGIALVSCVLPVLVVKGLSQPFLTPRELFLRTAALITLPALAWYWGERPFRRISFFGWAVVGVMAATGLSTLFSAIPAVSFWGNVDRLTGWVTMVELLVLGTTMYTAFRIGFTRRVVLICWCGAWAIVAVWGIAERLVPGFWAQFNGGGGRSAGTFGNPIFLANSLVAALAVALPAAFQLTQKKWRILCIGLLVLVGGWSIMFTETRGAYVGLVLGIVAFFSLMGWWSHRRFLRRGVVLIVLCLILGVLGVWVMRDHPVVKSISLINPYFSRAISVFNGNDPSQRQRFSLWRIAVRAVGERPLWGWGPEQFDTALDQLYDPHFTINDTHNSYSDRAHNVFLDVAVASGVLGLAAYLVLFGAIVWRVHLARRAGHLSTAAAAAAIGGVLAYLGTLITSFETIGTLLNLVFGTALLLSVSRPAAEAPPGGFQHPRWLVGGVVLLAGAVAFVLPRTVISVARASHQMHQVLTVADGPSVLRAAAVLRAIPEPYRAQYEERVANEIFKVVGNGVPGRSVPQDALLAEAETSVRDALGELRDHFGTRMMLGNVLLLKAAFGVGGVDDALAALRSAQQLAPQRQVTRIQMGNAFALAGELEQARSAFEEALAMDPSVPESQWHAARGRAAVGDVAGAATLFRSAWRGGFGEDRPDPELVIAINTLIAADDLFVVQDMYNEWVKHPDAPASRWASFAAVAARNGDRATAIRALREALHRDPTLGQEVPAFLQEYGLPSDALSRPASDV